MGGRPRILVIDDEEDLRTSVADVLRCMLDVDVQECASGPAAIAAHKASPAQMIIVDYRMPEMNGLETTTALRDVTPGLGVVLFTAFHDVSILDRARACDVDIVLPKPAQAEDLVAAVEAVLRRATHGTQLGIRPGATTAGAAARS